MKFAKVPRLVRRDLAGHKLKERFPSRFGGGISEQKERRKGGLRSYLESASSDVGSECEAGLNTCIS